MSDHNHGYGAGSGHDRLRSTTAVLRACVASVDDQIRFAAFLSMTGRGVSEGDAGAAMYAMHPFESDLPCVRALEKPVRKRSKKLARELRNTAPGDVGQVAIAAIREYSREAQASGDAIYTGRFGLLLEKYAGKGQEE